ncbi:unnamed protein product [Urochloa humidicola]
MEPEIATKQSTSCRSKVSQRKKKGWDRRVEKMALNPAVCSVNDVQGLRKATTFHPSLWGDFFLTYQPQTAPKRAYMTEKAEVLKEEVRKMLMGAKEIPDILDLVITLQRLGLDNYYENEIDEQLS